MPCHRLGDGQSLAGVNEATTADRERWAAVLGT